MDDTEMVERVRELRILGRSPKAIARTLGVPQSTVAPLIRSVAAEAAELAPEAPIYGCWVNTGWSAGLSVPGDRGWDDEDGTEIGMSGLLNVVVARKYRWDKATVCVYLVDAYCLGVKNTLGPKTVDTGDLSNFLRDRFTAYDGWQQAPYELARELVFGSVDYARGLGFEPEPDFAQVTDHLGAWTGPSAIGFGHDGQPLYTSGPNDDPMRVVKTLERSVGQGNFHYILGGPM